MAVSFPRILLKHPRDPGVPSRRDGFPSLRLQARGSRLSLRFHLPEDQLDGPVCPRHPERMVRRQAPGDDPAASTGDRFPGSDELLREHRVRRADDPANRTIPAPARRASPVHVGGREVVVIESPRKDDSVDGYLGRGAGFTFHGIAGPGEDEEHEKRRRPPWISTVLSASSERSRERGSRGRCRGSSIRNAVSFPQQSTAPSASRRMSWTGRSMNAPDLFFRAGNGRRCDGVPRHAAEQRQTGCQGLLPA